MIIIGTWGLGAIMDYNPDGNYGGFTYPSEENADECYVPVSIDDSWMISEEVPMRKLLLHFLSMQQGQRLTLFGAVPHPS